MVPRMREILAAAIFAFPVLGSAAPWLYQLQNPAPARIAVSGFTAAVIDYSRDGADAQRLRPSDLRLMHRAGMRVLAYLSIGEAESYRFYWQSAWLSGAAPAWLGRVDPDWSGNYKVRFWDVSWRNDVLRPYLDRILRQGFDGVYLDIIDAFTYWADPASYGPGGETFQAGDPRGNEAESARRMIQLVAWIADYGRRHSTAGRRFLVFPQNGEDILRYDRQGRYLRAISGIGVEDLFYDETRPQPADETAYRMSFLRRIRARGKTVFCVDYVDTGSRGDPANAARIADFVTRCEAEGFDFYAARRDRELDRINAIPGVQP
jgi:cysteinyl-tRNA synthetase